MEKQDYLLVFIKSDQAAKVKEGLKDVLSYGVDLEKAKAIIKTIEEIDKELDRKLQSSLKN